MCIRDSYEHTQIILPLPEGVSIVENISGALENVTDVQRGENNEWILTLPDAIAAQSSNTSTITIPLLLEGNGERGVGEELDFTRPARMETSFTIIDRMDPEHVVPSGKVYTKTVTSPDNLGVKKTTTDDVWGIEKASVGAAPSRCV